MGFYEGVAKGSLMGFIERYPHIGGAFFVVFGLLFGYLDGSIETERAHFWDGAQVTGTVLELPGKETKPDSYQMTARWLDSSGNSHSKTFDLERDELERLQVGGTVKLVLARADHSQAAVVDHVQPLGVPPPHTIAGVSFSDQIWFPLVCIGTGIALILYSRE